MFCAVHVANKDIVY